MKAVDLVSWLVDMIALKGNLDVVVNTVSASLLDFTPSLDDGGGIEVIVLSTED